MFGGGGMSLSCCQNLMVDEQIQMFYWEQKHLQTLKSFFNTFLMTNMVCCSSLCVQQKV